MFPLGHLGIGLLLARPFAGGRARLGAKDAAGLPLGWVALGTLAPDLLDKPLYYGLSLATGKTALDLGLVCGTRTFGHTALLLVTATAIAWSARHRAVAALALGAATHVLLDHLGDAVGVFLDAAGYPEGFSWESRRVTGLLWPFLGPGFQVMPFREPGDHLATFLRPHILIGEALGAVVLLQEWLRNGRSAAR